MAIELNLGNINAGEGVKLDLGQQPATQPIQLDMGAQQSTTPGVQLDLGGQTPTPTAAPLDKTQWGDRGIGQLFIDSLQRGTYNSIAQVSNLGEYDDTTANFKALAAENPRAVGSIKDVLATAERGEYLNAVGDFVGYGVEAIGETLPVLAVGVGTAAAAVAAAAAAGASAPVLLAAGLIGGAAGSTPFLAGESKENVETAFAKEGMTEDNGERRRADINEYIGQTTAKTMLELIPITKIMRMTGLNKVFGKSMDDALDATASSIFKEAGKVGAIESLTEVGQTLTDIVATNILTDKDTLNMDEGDWWQLADSFIQGGIAGGAIGGTVQAVGVGRSARNKEPIAPTPQRSKVQGDVAASAKGLEQDLEMRTRAADNAARQGIPVPQDSAVLSIPVAAVAQKFQSQGSNTKLQNMKPDTTGDAKTPAGITLKNVGAPVVTVGIKEDMGDAAAVKIRSQVEVIAHTALPGQKVNVITNKTADRITGESTLSIAGRRSLAFPSSGGTSIIINTSEIAGTSNGIDTKEGLDRVENAIVREINNTVAKGMYDRAESPLKSTILKDYQGWVADQRNLTTREFFSQVFSDPAKIQSAVDSHGTASTYDYREMLTFERFAADQMQHGANVVTAPHWAKTRAMLDAVNKDANKVMSSSKTLDQRINDMRKIADTPVPDKVRTTPMDAAVKEVADQERKDHEPRESLWEITRNEYVAPELVAGTLESDIQWYGRLAQSHKTSMGTGILLKSNPHHIEGDTLQTSRTRLGTKMLSIDKPVADVVTPENMNMLATVNPQIANAIRMGINETPTMGVSFTIGDLFKALNPVDRDTLSSFLKVQEGYHGVFVPNATTGDISAMVWDKEMITSGPKYDKREGLEPRTVLGTAAKNMGMTEEIVDGVDKQELLNSRMHSMMENEQIAKIMMYVKSPRQFSNSFNFGANRNMIMQFKDFVQISSAMNSEKYKRSEETGETAKMWKKLKGKNMDAVSEFFLQRTTESDRLGLKLDETQQLELFKQIAGNYPSPAQQEVMTRVDTQLQQDLQGMETASLRMLMTAPESGYTVKEFSEVQPGYMKDLQRNVPAFQRNANLQAKLEELTGKPARDTFLTDSLRMMEQFDTISTQGNYFPMKRFGSFVVTTKDEDGDIVSFETFDLRTQQQARLTELEGSADTVIASYKLDDMTSSMVNMPGPFIDHIVASMDNAGVKPSLEQMDVINAIKASKTAGQGIMKHLNKRAGTAGFSRDAMRVFASYRMSAAANEARVTYGAGLYGTIKSLKAEIIRIQNTPGETFDTTTLGVIADYMQDQYKYISNPSSDFAMLRQLGFVMFLGLNVKSAAVNLTQTPMITYPMFTQRLTRFGVAHGVADAAVAKALTKAMTSASFRGKKAMLNRMTNKIHSSLMQDGTIGGSTFASELATTADPYGQTLFGYQQPVAMFNKAVDFSATFFSMAEQVNRRVAMFASIELNATHNPEWSTMTQDERTSVVRNDVLDTQFEFTTENRSKMMQGVNAPTVLLFQNYMLSALNIYAGGEGKGAAMRSLMVLAAMGGIMALPGAEDLVVIIEWLLAGEDDNEYTNLKEDARSMVSGFFDPDILLYGATGRGVSILPMFDSTADLSASVSMGHLIPGLNAQYSQDDTTAERIGKFAQSAGGPVAGIFGNAYKAMFESDMTAWHRAQTAAPASIRQAIEGTRIMYTGEIQNKRGDMVLDLAPDDQAGRSAIAYEQIMKGAVQALGFPLSDKTGYYEFMTVEREKTLFYSIRRSNLRATLVDAFEGGDARDVRNAEIAIDVFNKTVMGIEGLQAETISVQSERAAFKQSDNNTWFQENNYPANDKLELRESQYGNHPNSPQAKTGRSMWSH